jgi:protein-S-isoprenylcysteine O-methyltransferase Ste14
LRYWDFYHLFVGAWVLWIVSWVLAALWSARTTARPSLIVEAPNRIITFVGFLMMGRAFRLDWGVAWRLELWAVWFCFALTIGGFAFAWWARLHLGALWSGTVTRKQDHRVIDTGPYRFVRHPIYTGLITSAFATASAAGYWEMLAGACLIMLGFWLKARLEESFLIEGLGEAEYAAYRARVPMLIPFTKGWGGGRV